MEDYYTNDFVINEIKDTREDNLGRFFEIVMEFNPTLRGKHYDLTLDDVMGDNIIRSSQDIKLADQRNEEFIFRETKTVERWDPVVYYLRRNEIYKNLYSICEFCGKTFLKNIDGADNLCHKCKEHFDNGSPKEDFDVAENTREYDLRDIF